MPVHLSEAFTVASYVLKQKIRGRKRYPLVLMLGRCTGAIWHVPGAGKFSTRPCAEARIDA